MTKKLLPYTKKCVKCGKLAILAVEWRAYICHNDQGKNACGYWERIELKKCEKIEIDFGVKIPFSEIEN